MAGIVHDVENRGLLDEVRQQAADAAKELAEALLKGSKALDKLAVQW